MITENDIAQNLINTMDEKFKKILIDFCNNFLKVFPNAISKNELLSRINKLVYIGFEQNDIRLKVSGEADARFNSSFRNIAVSLKHFNLEFNKLKSLIYHELIHAISYHAEIDYDTINKQEICRSGLNRGQVDVVIDDKYDGYYAEGDIFDEIMTEYYNILLLEHENINLTQTNILSSDFEQDFVMSHGTGYQEIAGLGRIYDYFWGQELLYAKLHDGNNFRNTFNNIFKGSGIFDHIFPDIPLTEYSKFVGERGTFERYRTACKIFVKFLKNKYSNQEFPINIFLLNAEITAFMEFLIKTKTKGNDTESQTNHELYILLRELEVNLLRELTNSKPIQNEHYNINIDAIIYDAFIKLCSSNPGLNLNELNYQYFNHDDFIGIIIYFENKKYLINAEDFSQNNNFVQAQTFSEFGFSTEEIQEYSKEYGINISNAEFFTIYTHLGTKSFILSEGQLYNHHGYKIETSNFQKYFVEETNQYKGK